MLRLEPSLSAFHAAFRPDAAGAPRFFSDKTEKLFNFFSDGEMQDGRPVIRTETFARKIIEHLDALRSKSDNKAVQLRKGILFLNFEDMSLLVNDLGGGFGTLTKVTPPLGKLFGYTVDWYFLNGKPLVTRAGYQNDKIDHIGYARHLMEAMRKDNGGAIGYQDFAKFIG